MGEAAGQLGLEPHVLRHSEDVGALVPIRTAAGHRRYGRDERDQARLTRRLKKAGLSLNEIRLLSIGDRTDHESVVAARLAALAAQLEEARRAIASLEHSRSCSHRIIATCPECDAYTNADPGT